ncbi:MAG: hypothetical protein Q7T40_02575 [Methylobacter sp.]|nr:hypothetical protein [Methylobacter sp.]
MDLISRLIDLIPGSERRCAMGDVTLSLLNGKHRVAENVFSWNRHYLHKRHIPPAQFCNRNEAPQTAGRHKRYHGAA